MTRPINCFWGIERTIGYRLITNVKKMKFGNNCKNFIYCYAFV